MANSQEACAHGPVHACNNHTELNSSGKELNERPHLSVWPTWPPCGHDTASRSPELVSKCKAQRRLPTGKVRKISDLLSLCDEMDDIVKQVTPVPVTDVLPDLVVAKNVVSFPGTMHRRNIDSPVSRLNKGLPGSYPDIHPGWCFTQRGSQCSIIIIIIYWRLIAL